MQKKVIYLDQYVISNIMKVLNPASNKKIDPLWKDIYIRLNKLVKLQAAICPISSIHKIESRMYKDFKKIEKVSINLSNGICFKNLLDLKLNQLLDGLVCWLYGINFIYTCIDRKQGFNYDIEKPLYFPKLYATSPDIPFYAQGLRNIKKASSQFYNENMIKDVWPERWANFQSTFFIKTFEDEASAFGKVTLQLYKEFCEKQIKILKRIMPNNVFNNQKTPSSIVIDSIGYELNSLGISNNDAAKIICDYLLSDTVKQLYFNKIYAALISVAARQYCSNKIKERNVSLLNDLETISILLPYCDVMVVDNECREFLNQNDAKKYIYPYKTIIFSKNNIEQFKRYLIDLENNVPNEYKKNIVEKLGADFLEPELNLFT